MVYKCALHCRNVHEDEDENNGDADDDNKEDNDNGEDNVILMMKIDVNDDLKLLTQTSSSETLLFLCHYLHQKMPMETMEYVMLPTQSIQDPSIIRSNLLRNVMIDYYDW